MARQFDEFKVGDIVRIISLTNVTKHTFKVGEEFEIIKVGNHAYEDIVFKGVRGIGVRFADIELVEDTSNYITTKEFIKEAEKLGYDVEIEQGIEINVTDGHFEISIYIEESDYLNIEYFGNVKNILPLLKLIIKYLETPIEFREVKEYTLQCPLTGAYLCINSTTSGNTVWLHKNNFRTNKDSVPKFTQQEIDQLPNQELIKTLIKKEVKND